MWPMWMNGMRGGPFGMSGSVFDDLAVAMKEQAKKEHAADRLAMLAASAPVEIPVWFEGPLQPPESKPPANPFPDPKGSKEKRAKDIADEVLSGDCELNTLDGRIEDFEQPIKRKLADFIASYRDWYKSALKRSARIASGRYFAWRAYYAREVLRELDRA